jgi:hypothetical protein
MTVVDFLEVQQQQIRDRLRELEPLVREYRRLEAAVAALAAIDHGPAATRAPAATPAAPKRGPGRPRGTAKAAAPKPAEKPARKPRGAATGSRGRRKGSGKRAAEALALVQGQPGITIAEMAGKMGVKPNYLYRVLPGLKDEGKVQRKGHGWHPTAAG